MNVKSMLLRSCWDARALIRRRRMAVGVLASAALTLLAATTVFAETLPQYRTDKHEGVATCASGMCHGSVQVLETKHVQQNEFITWTQQDKHANAYQTLLSERSRQIARNLGLGSPQDARVCLDCHTDNVPPAQRGEKFKLADGIGCETCHGGSERWLAAHPTSTSHQANVDLGMYPTHNVRARADLCLSCHLGTEKKFATHRMMAAGHPRLAFELDTFGVLQPQHYRVDNDYIERKGSPGSVGTWVAGLVTAAKRNLELVQGPLFTSNAAFGEIAIYDCNACHHEKGARAWTPRKENARVGPGEIRLNDANLVLLASVAEVMAPGQQRALVDGVQDLHAAMRGPVSGVVAAARRLEGIVDQVGGALTRDRVGGAEMKRILGNLFQEGQQGQYRDYVAAEQAVMGIDLLLIASGMKDGNRGGVDRLYATVQDEHKFDVAKFSESLAALHRQTGL